MNENKALYVERIIILFFIATVGTVFITVTGILSAIIGILLASILGIIYISFLLEDTQKLRGEDCDILVKKRSI